jgi:surface polysaccharide O-acyltransferase-like enzyme
MWIQVLVDPEPKASRPAMSQPSTPTTHHRAHVARDIRVDALRGLAIAMVVATHVLRLRHEFVGVAPWLVAGMVAFNMPLFAFLSGWVLSGREGHDPLRFIGKKALALVVPFIAWVAIELPIRHVKTADILPRLGTALMNPHAGLQMWFLLVLFWMFVIFIVARAISRTSLWLAATGIAMGALLLLPLPQTMAIDKIAWLYPFFILGYLAARHRSAVGGRRGLAIKAVGAVIAVLAVFVLKDVALRFDLALLGMAVCGLVYVPLPRRVLTPQAWLGQRSMGVYGGQMVLLPFLIVGAGLGPAFSTPWFTVGQGWIGAIASWALVLTAVAALTWVLEHIPPLKWVLLGQWPKTKRTF